RSPLHRSRRAAGARHRGRDVDQGDLRVAARGGATCDGGDEREALNFPPRDSGGSRSTRPWQENRRTMATLRIRVDATRSVSALLMEPRDARSCLVLAHGAGAGMTHPFMAAAAQGLAARRVATLRYQFPYMEQGLKRPDSAPLAQATVRAAVAEANKRLPGLPLLAGGKSFGGRMTSQAQAQGPLDAVRGLVFFGFPLHAAGKPSDQRA